MEMKKSTISSPAASPEDIHETLPVPSDLDILSSPSHTNPWDPVVPAVPPGYDVPPGFNVTPKGQKKPGRIRVRVRKSKTPVSDETTTTNKDQPVVRTLSEDLALLALSSNAATQHRVHEEAIYQPVVRTLSEDLAFLALSSNAATQHRICVISDKLKRSIEKISQEDGVQILPNMNPNDLLTPLFNAVTRRRAHAQAIIANFDALRCRLEQTIEEGRVKIKKPNMKAANDLGLSEDLELLASPLYAVTQPRVHAEALLAAYDALRRRLEQIHKGDGVYNRPDMKAESIMKKNNLMANKEPQDGPVPGVEVGDIFYFRMEMPVVGLHCLSMGGIFCMGNGVNKIAIAIVSSGGYDNEDNNAGELVYTGEGGKGKKKLKGGKRRKVKQRGGHQKLEGGNYAMNQSRIQGKLIRVIRSRKDPFNRVNNIYIYDGLYKIHEMKTEQTLKFVLFKEPGQPEGFANWIRTKEWKENPSSRGDKVLTWDLSSGKESIPVIVVNEVDDELEPNNFVYVISTTVVKATNIEQTRRENDKLRAGCKCKKKCIPGRTGCYCESENGGWLPYSSSGLLTKRLPMLYECGSGCGCTINCQNRVTGRGIKVHFEVFRTENGGWGLRSWDPIRAGSFVCEFVGEHLEWEKGYRYGEHKEKDKEMVLNGTYVFGATHPGKKAMKWNLGMELAVEGEDQKCYCYYEPEQKPVPVISAKLVGNMSRFINHSCDPNLFWQLVRYRQWQGQHTHVMFFALKHIPPLTELTYDYNGDV